MLNIEKIEYENESKKWWIMLSIANIIEALVQVLSFGTFTSNIRTIFLFPDAEDFEDNNHPTWIEFIKFLIKK